MTSLDLDARGFDDDYHQLTPDESVNDTEVSLHVEQPNSADSEKLWIEVEKSVT